MYQNQTQQVYMELYLLVELDYRGLHEARLNFRSNPQVVKPFLRGLVLEVFLQGILIPPKIPLFILVLIE
jgi:hypothetical protein